MTQIHGLDRNEQPPVVSVVNAVGTVKWFDQRKGYGFIVGPEGSDVMAHYTDIVGPETERRVLRDGESVTYDAALGTRGWRATRVLRAPGQSSLTDTGRRPRSARR